VLEVSATINAPATVAWRLLTDTHAWPQWGPSIRTVEVPTRVISAGIAATGHLVEATGPDSCEVTFTIPAWAPFYVPVCRAALRAIERLATQAEPRR